MNSNEENPLGMLMEAGVVKPYGAYTNRLLDMPTIVKIMTSHDQLRQDMVVQRGQIDAGLDAETNRLVFNFGNCGRFFPTQGAVRQIAEKAKIPVDFLRENIRKYPDLAATMVNKWLKDDEVVNMIGTSRERRVKVDAMGQKQLVRTFKKGENTPGVLRAILSSKYLIVNNTDILAEAITVIERRKLKVTAHGTLTDDNMHVRFKCPDIANEVQFKNKGVGHEMVKIPCGASLLLQGSETGMGSIVVAPEIEFFVCSNLARSSEALTQIHLGKEYDDMGMLSDETVKKMSMAIFARMKDIISATLTIDGLKKLSERMFMFAGEKVEKAQTVIENVTDKFGLDKDSTKSVLDRFIQEGRNCRFGLSQAFTAEAHKYRGEDFQKSLAFEDAGSKILTLKPDAFGVFTREPAKN